MPVLVPYGDAVRRLAAWRRAPSRAAGLVSPLVGDVWAWEGRYDGVRGLVAEGRDPADLVV